jgi:hypothetical protein
MLVSAVDWEIKMNTFNHSYYESNNFREDGSVIIDMHASRLKIKMHIPEQKIILWADYFRRNKARNSQLRK